MSKIPFAILKISCLLLILLPSLKCVRTRRVGTFSLRDVIRGSDASPSLEAPPSPVCLLPNMWEIQLHKLLR